MAEGPNGPYTLQTDPEKSRDFIIKNPGILADVKSWDPGIPGIPLLARACTLHSQQTQRIFGKKKSYLLANSIVQDQ